MDAITITRNVFETSIRGRSFDTWEQLVAVVKSLPADDARHQAPPCSSSPPSATQFTEWKRSPGGPVQDVESAARWTGDEWKMNMAALTKEACGQGERLACHFTGDASAHLIFGDSSHGLRASTAGQLEGGVSLCLQLPHEMGWEQYARGSFRNVVGKALWGEKAADVLPGNKDADKINLLIVVKVKEKYLDDPTRHVPGRDAIVILPRREPELTSADGHFWLPKEQIVKVYRLAGDNKALDIAVANNMHDLAVAWSTDEMALAVLTEYKGGKEIAAGAKHLAFLWENGLLSKLAKLDASDYCDLEGAKALALLIKASASLTEVDVRNNKIAGDAALQLSAAVLANNKIEKFNQIPIKGMRADLLTTLDMFGKNSGVEGGMVVAGLLPVMTSLTALDLSSNNLVGDINETSFVKAAEVQGESFEVGANVSYKGRAMVVSKGIDRDGEIKMTGVPDLTGVKAIADALSVSTSLTRLDLSQNHLCGISLNYASREWDGTYTAEGINAIAHALRVNTSLTALDVRYNDLGDEGARAVKEAVRSKSGFNLLI